MMTMIKTKRSTALVVPWVFLVFLVLSGNACQRPVKPQDYGVKVEWKRGGATSSYPWIEVWVDTPEIHVASPMIFGGIEDPNLSYRDIDGDGVLDIVFGNKSKKQILAYKPSKHAFVVLRNDMQGKEY